MSEAIALFTLGAVCGALFTLVAILIHADITTRRMYQRMRQRDAQALDAIEEKRPGVRLRAIDGGPVTTSRARKP